MREKSNRRSHHIAVFLPVMGLGAALVAGSPALAQPIAYEGIIGGERIVLELTDDPFSALEKVEGRFTYLEDGSDIPLLFSRSSASELVLTEESPCALTECDASKPAINAIWMLGPGKGRREIVGKRQKDGEEASGVLRYIGERPRDEGEERSAYGLFSVSDQLSMSSEAIRADTHPYEYAKLNVPVEVSGPLDFAKQLDFAGSAIAYVIDPRTRFVWPRIERLADGSSPSKVNAMLEQARWRKNLSAFSCRSMRYMTLRGGDEAWSSDVGSLGGYDDTIVQVSFLDPRLLSYQESGSLWCGGASPTNFIKPVVIDVQRGEEISASALFAGWEDGLPPEGLIALVRSRLSKESEEMDGGGDCSFDNLSNYLAAYLAASNPGRIEVRFGLYNLPTVAVACTRDVATFQLDEIAEYLTPMGASLLE